ncbi:MAG: hypothetical protein ACETVX_05940, partial [bacterium]
SSSRDGTDAIFTVDTNNEQVEITGYVGIGMTNPALALDVTGDIRLTNTFYTKNVNAYDDAAGGIKFRNNAGSVTVFQIDTFNQRVGTLDTSPDFGFEIANSSSLGYLGISGNTAAAGDGDGDIFVIDENGYVGINDDNPGYYLSVDGTASISDDFYVGDDLLFADISEDTVSISGDFQVQDDDLFVDISTGKVGIGTNSPLSPLHVSANIASMRITDADSNVEAFMAPAGDGTVIIGSFTNHPIDIATNESDKRIRINTDGSVGIYDTTPDAKFDVAGSGIFDNELVVAGALQVDGTTSAAYSRFGSNTTTHTLGSVVGDVLISSRLEVDGTAYFDGAVNFEGISSGSVFYAHDGSVGVPSYTFSSDTDTGMYLGSAGNLSFTTGGTERLRIDDSGLVGIGDTTPDAKFDVAGSGIFDNELILGEALQVGGTTSEAYSRFGTGTTTHSDYITGSDDLLISGDLEVNGSVSLDSFLDVDNGTLFVDATANLVGIGTTAPADDFHIDGGAVTRVILEGNRTGSGNPFTQIQFYNTDTALYVGAEIDSWNPGATDNSGDLRFYTNSDGTSDPTANLAERMRITYSGDVGIGDTTPDARFDVADSGIFDYGLIVGSMLQVGSTSSVSYSRFGAQTTGYGDAVSSSADLLISDNLEVDGQAWFDSNASVSGALEAGSIKGNGAVPSGMIGIFDGACPTNWTEVTGYQGKFLRGDTVGNVGGTGGTSTHTHGAGSFAVNPAPTNTGNQSVNHTHSVTVPGIWTQSGTDRWVGQAGAFNSTGASVDHTHTVDIGSTGVTGNSDSAGTLPPYINVVYCKKDTVPGSDLAEVFLTEEAGLGEGDVLVTGVAARNVKKSTGAYQKELLGVVSAKPGYVLTDGDIEGAENKVIVALIGRVLVKVTTKNGLIEVGDWLTSSDIPGVAMKATEPGPILGKSLENWGGNPDEIAYVMTFVNLGWYGGDVGVPTSSITGQVSTDTVGIGPLGESAAVQSTTDTTQVAQTVSSGTNQVNTMNETTESGTLVNGDINTSLASDSQGILLSQISVDSDLDMAGYGIYNISKLVGLGESWAIDEFGNFNTEGAIFAKKEIVSEGGFWTKGLFSKVITVKKNEVDAESSSGGYDIQTKVDKYESSEGMPRLPVAEDEIAYQTYGTESIRVEVQASGTGVLEGGEARIIFDPSFRAIISDQVSYKVIITPTSKPRNLLYVAEKNPDGFLVRGMPGEYASFDWLVIATKRGYEPTELPQNLNTESSQTQTANQTPTQPTPTSSNDQTQTNADSTQTNVEGTSNTNPPSESSASPEADATGQAGQAVEQPAAGQTTVTDTTTTDTTSTDEITTESAPTDTTIDTTSTDSITTEETPSK